MCGIVGITGNPEAVNIVLEGLSRMEYRGYDSAGLAAQTNDGSLHMRKAVGKLTNLRNTLTAAPMPEAVTCIGHTRWATHGTPTTANAHPHSGHIGEGPEIAAVHNGIIENYYSLREQLQGQGANFLSETDTETIPFLLSSLLAGKISPLTALHQLSQRLNGGSAIATTSAAHPGMLFATRKGAPLCLGIGNGWNALASDPIALAGLTDSFIFLEDGDCALLTPNSITIMKADGTPATRLARKLNLAGDLAGKQGHRHFMLKEMLEQPIVVSQILESYTSPDGTPKIPQLPSHISTINIVACGTAFHAGLIGKYLFEDLAGIPVNVDIASEFRYRNPPLPENGLFIAVSQSGETADTLAALEYAKARGQHILALTNVNTSSIARAADTVMDLHAGREVAVASTKAFTAMVVVLTLIAIKLRESGQNKTDGGSSISELIGQLRTLPIHLQNVLADHSTIQHLAEDLITATSMLYLGRGNLAPLAFEGALKMKEISYIHAEGYASGEMKHGPIALVDSTLPVVNLASGQDGLFEKTLSNLREVEARKGQVILITDTSGAAQLDPTTLEKLFLIKLPDVPKLCIPSLFTIPLQLLAYYTATAKGTDVDQPRNLAKSVTVE